MLDELGIFLDELIYSLDQVRHRDYCLEQSVSIVSFPEQLAEYFDVVLSVLLARLCLIFHVRFDRLRRRCEHLSYSFGWNRN